MTSQLGVKNKDAAHESDADPPPLVLPAPKRPAMSGSRRACFFFSISLCFLVVIGFLFVLPCDLPGCVFPSENALNSSNTSSQSSSISSLRSIRGSWERTLPGIELKGRVHLVPSSLGSGLNMVFLVRGQLPGLLSSSSVAPPAMSLVSSSFLSESSNCSFAPSSDVRSASSVRNYDRAAPSSYCNTYLGLTSNFSSQIKTSDSVLKKYGNASLYNKSNEAVSHYRSKRILHSPSYQFQINVNQSLAPVRGLENGDRIAKVADDAEHSKSPISNKTRQEKVKTVKQKDKLHAGVISNRKRSSSNKGSEFGDDTEFDGAVIGTGGMVSLSGATGLPLWQLPLPSPPEELDCGLLDTDGDGVPDCLAFAGHSGLLAAVNPSTGAVIWYLHDHKSQMRPTALQFPVSIPDLDGDGTNELAVACTLPNSINQNVSSKVAVPLPNSSSYSPHLVNSKASDTKPAPSSKKELIFSSSTSDLPFQLSPRPLPSPSSSPDTVSLALASGRSGSIIGLPFTPPGCVTVSSITLNVQTLNLFYRCITEGGDETGESLSVDDLYGKRFEGALPSTSASSSNLTSSFTSSSQILKQSTLSTTQDATASTSSTVLDAPLPFSTSPLSSLHSQRHSTSSSSSAWVSDHRLLVENHGQCHSILLSSFLSYASTNSQPPCSVSVRLTDSRNATLWAHEGVLAHAMDPVPLLFRQPSGGVTSESSSTSFRSESGIGEHPVSGFVLKFWQWSVPKREHGSVVKDDKSRDLNNGMTPGGPNSLFRTRLKHSTSRDFMLPPNSTVDAASWPVPSAGFHFQNSLLQNKRQSPIGNLPHHGGLFPGVSGKKKQKGTSYKGVYAPIVNQLKERVVLITFNDTGLHVINASQSEVTQLCERVRGFAGGGKRKGKVGKGRANAEAGSPPEQKLRCQPELAYQEQSLLVADLDKDGYQELVSYLTTYTDSQKDESELKSHSNAPRWHLESRVKVVLLEAELPKLYEAVATPGS